MRSRPEDSPAPDDPGPPTPPPAPFPRLVDAGPPTGPTAATGLAALYWDPIRRRLWLGARLLRGFDRPAPAQEALLAACQARGWAAGYHPLPLPPEPDEPPEAVRDRVHGAVRKLNDRLPPGGLRFHQDPAGTGVWWEVGPPPGGG